MTIARTDRHGAWSCFASALAERRVVVHETRAAQHLLLKPHLRATSLGDDVVVPPQSGDACPPRAALRLVVMRQLVGMATAAGHASRSPLWRRVFRTLELQRIDAAIARTYPGASVDLARWRAATLSSRPAAAPHASLRANLEALLQWALGAAPSSHDAVATAAQVAHDDASALHSAATATRICELLCTRWRPHHRHDDRESPVPLEENATTAGGNRESPSLAMPNLALPGHARATSSAAGAGPLAGDLADSATWRRRTSSMKRVSRPLERCSYSVHQPGRKRCARQSHSSIVCARPPGVSCALVGTEGRGEERVRARTGMHSSAADARAVHVALSARSPANGPAPAALDVARA